ncbi:MAG: YbhB/YbcL family Raf kinase inhibitor-like protein [Chloroflexi bacterium]|nr:YbhB/YbcL family Raf kinase inhibitor-like protein [Chloroflexota bacterium]
MNRFVLILTLGFLACSSSQVSPAETEDIPAASVPTVAPTVVENIQEVDVKFELTSPAFANGDSIPADFSCKGRDVSPALAWTEPPAGAQSFALIMDDPDAPVGTWVHWVIYNIPASARGLPESVPTDPQLRDGSVQGVTSARSTGYHGPCPPSDTHRYFFKLYALDTMLSMQSADKKQLLAAMEGHVLGTAELMGTFSR